MGIADPLGVLLATRRRALGMSQADLADELARVSGRDTLTRHEISRWERGVSTPGRLWLSYLAHVLEVPVRDLRVARAEHGDAIPLAEGSPWAGDTVTSVVQLGRWDVQRREFLASSAYALSALAIPDLEEMTRPARLAGTGSLRVGAGEVVAIREMTRVLGDAASELGGGHARHLAIHYLTHEVADWLGGSYLEKVGRDLYGAVSQLAHLAGWMAADEGKQGLAQRYYVHSYRLAAEAGDPELSATALRGLAVQAIQLGHAAEALRLSEAAAQWERRLEDYRAVSYVHCTVAEAASLAGERSTALQRLAQSETAMGRAPDGHGETWAGHYTLGPWAHEAAVTLLQLGDYDGAEEHLQLALAAPGLRRRRSRATILAHLGDVYLRRGDLAGALDRWSEFMAAAEGVRSIRLGNAVRGLRISLRPYLSDPDARELDERARLYSADPTLT